MKVLLVLCVALFGACLAQVDINARLDAIEAEIQALAAPDDAPAAEVTTGPPSTSFSTSQDLPVDGFTELESLPQGFDAAPADGQQRATTVGGSTFDVGTMVGITCGVFFAGVAVFVVVMALFRRSNLINDMKINTVGSREYQLPWKRHQIVFLCVIAAATVLLTLGAALTYYFVTTSQSAGLGTTTTETGARALLMTPPNGPTPNWGAPCSNQNSPACIKAWVDITNKARAKERVKKLVLPSNYAKLTVAQKNLVLVNLERRDRGLRPFRSPLVAKYNSLALSGARRHADPTGPSGHSWGSNWCGSSNALMCNYLYMYWDGPGGTNIDCKRASSPGCWGHRKNILRKWSSTVLHMGSAVAGSSSTQLFVAG